MTDVGDHARTSTPPAHSHNTELPAFKKRLQGYLGNVRQLMTLVQEAEGTFTEPKALCEIYETAMRLFGPLPLQLAREEYGELCVRRLKALSLTDREEARQFHRFMRHSGIRQDDARSYLVRAEMEARAGHAGKALATIEEGLSTGAQPAEPLLALARKLGRSTGAPGVAARTSVGGIKAQSPVTPTTASASAGANVGTSEQCLPPALPQKNRLRPEGTAAAALSGASGNSSAASSARGSASECAASPAVPVPAGDWSGRTSSRGPSLANLSPIVEADSVEDISMSRDEGAGEDREPGGSSGFSVFARRAAASACVLTPPPLPRRTPAAPLAPSVCEQRGKLTEQERRCLEAQVSTASPDHKPTPPQTTVSVPTTGGASAPATSGDAELSDLSVPMPEVSASDSGGGSKSSKTIVVNNVSYARLETIGRGGSSKVYRVQAPNGELRALKRVATSCSAHFEALANEVTLLQQLKDCPNVIQIYDAEVLPKQGLIHIVMEPGQMDLARLLQSEPDIHLGDIQSLWRQMLEAVQVIHDERIVHSDIKPGNFLLVGSRLKLIDFGIAKRIASETTHISRESSVGTISYMAPEAVKQGTLKLGRSSDVWSLGIILYQMVYRRSPFAHLDPMQRLFAISDPNVSVPFPDEHRLQGHTQRTKAMLIDVLKRCLERDPRHRPQIPELLRHPFLCDRIAVTRGICDKTVESVFRGLCEIAWGVLVQEQRSTQVGEEVKMHEEGVDEDADIVSEGWQALSDEVWERLSAASDGGPLPGSNEARDERDGDMQVILTPFRLCLQRWLAQGSKRRRLLESEQLNSAGAADTKGMHRSRPKAPAPPLPLAFGTGQNAPPALTRAPTTKAEQIAPTGFGRDLKVAPAGLGGKPRAPLGELNNGGVPLGNGAIQADLLIKQRNCLKKVSSGAGAAPAPGGKENAAPPPAGPSRAENVVLKRLKDRRALVADDRQEDELTQLTRWAVM